MGAQQRIDIKNAARERIKKIEFGDPVTNVCAGEGNTRRLGYFCEYAIKSRKNKFGVVHSEHLAKLTDKKGNFWNADIEVIFPGHLDYKKSGELFKPIWEAHYGKFGPTGHN